MHKIWSSSSRVMSPLLLTIGRVQDQGQATSKRDRATRHLLWTACSYLFLIHWLHHYCRSLDLHDISLHDLLDSQTDVLVKIILLKNLSAFKTGNSQSFLHPLYSTSCANAETNSTKKKIWGPLGFPGWRKHFSQLSNAHVTVQPGLFFGFFLTASRFQFYRTHPIEHSPTHSSWRARAHLQTRHFKYILKILISSFFTTEITMAF